MNIQDYFCLFLCFFYKLWLPQQLPTAFPYITLPPGATFPPTTTVAPSM